MLPYQTISQKEYGISIVGIGGAGANVLQCFGSSSAEHVKLFTMSLDERVGRACGNVEFIQLGEALSRGLGSGGDPEVGCHAMEESAERVKVVFDDCKLLVMVVGLGGGTGSGAAPVLAKMAHEAGVFLVSVIMMPFSFEGKRRREQADKALEEVARLSDIVFCFENDYMEELFRNRSGARAVFEEVDRLLAKATASVPMMATSPGLINLGLDELATALKNRDSRCIFGSGSGYGKDRAEEAARAAVGSPLAAYHGALRYARSVIVHIAGGESLSLTEIRQAMEIVRKGLGNDEVEIFFGTTVKPHLGDEMRLTLIASIDSEEFKTALLQEETAAPAIEEVQEEEAPPPAEEEERVEEEEQQFVDEEEDYPEREAQPAEQEVEEPAEDEEVEEPEEEVEEEEEEDEEPEELPQPEQPRETAPAPIPTAPQEPRRMPEPEKTPEPQPRPAPMPKPEPERTAPLPRRAPAPAPAPEPQPEPPKQLDLFSGPPIRQAEPTERYTPPPTLPRNMRATLPPAAYPPPPGGNYGPEATRRRVGAMPGADDLDTPPSLRFNDLRDIFPDN